jgi:hypothetical protein
MVSEIKVDMYKHLSVFKENTNKQLNKYKDDTNKQMSDIRKTMQHTKWEFNKDKY